jgi:flagellar L-ring protein precursor FlgH
MTFRDAAGVLRVAAACAVLALVTGCANLAHMQRTVEVQQPMTARPTLPQLPPGGNGGIFQPTAIANGVVYQPLFEDRRARAVGDTLTIVINERINASKQASSTADRTGSTKFEIASIKTPTGQTYQGGAITGGSGQAFEGKGDSSANNVITGSITVSVIEVLSNGNMVVSGEKQIGINQGSEFIRLSGVVNPHNIGFGNTVSSTQIADAKIEYRGTGYIDEAQTMGWLARVFQSILPF